jgi:CubicO group peptidase (beta-lactamase class C family)
MTSYPTYAALLTCFVMATTAAGQQQTAYLPPVFDDAERLQKIEKALPAIEKIYRDFAAQKQVPGLAFGVVVDGQLVFSKGLGYTHVPNKTPVTPQSVFRIASMTKSFTTTAIMQLRDAGKLRLDDPAHLYIPELKKVALLTADAPVITVRNLMAHSAGFPEDNPWGDRQLADTEAELTQLMAQGVSFANVSGVAYEYSNLAFAMLGRIITRVSGMPYQRYITQNILQPLGMTHTYWEYDNVPAPLLARGYRLQNGTWQEEPMLHDGSHGAMGGLLTSIEDLAKYAALHLSAWPPRNDADRGVLKRSSLREMHQPATFSGMNPNFKYPDGRLCPTTSSYCYGLNHMRDCEGRVYVGHSGGLPGFGSQWRMLPEYGIAVMSHANLTYAGTGAANLEALDALVRLADLKPRSVPVSSTLAERKAQLIKLLPDFKDAEKSGIFAENFFLDESEQRRREQYQVLFGKAGKIKNITALIPENQLRGKFVLECEHANIEVFLTLTPEKTPLIQQLDLK